MRGRHPARAMVWRLVLADQRHEWILTLCLVMAVASVLAPLLVLLGLKHGTIQTLRERLVEDPVYRELRPAATSVQNAAWFERWRRHPAVAFLVPTVLPASSIIQARARDGGWHNLDLVPTAQGDALLLAHGAQIPVSGEVVLSMPAARRLGAENAQTVALRATRIRGGRREYAPIQATLAAVLPPAATALEVVYAPLELVLDIEAFKEGQAIPARGWPGGVPPPPLRLDGIVVAVGQPLDPVEVSGLAVDTGVTSVTRIPAGRFQRLFGFDPAAGITLYHLGVERGTLPASSVEMLRKRKLRGHSAAVIPYVKPLQVELICRAEGEIGEVQDITLFGLSLDDRSASLLATRPTPWSGFDPQRPQAGLRQIILPEVTGAAGETCEVAAGPELHFPVDIADRHAATRALAPLELAATLNHAAERNVIFDPALGSFKTARAGYRGFRIYARSIDQVLSLKRSLERSGVEVIARTDEIERIAVLDRGLTRIFWLIATIGIAGGAAVLVASLYAAVERKQRELCIARLLGMSRATVFRFPVYQALVVVVCGIAVAAGLYWGFAWFINRAFADALTGAQRIASLPAVYWLWAGAAAIAIAVLSSLGAAWRTTRLDPARGMRDE